MVDFIRNNIERIMKLENSKVGRLNKSNTISTVSDENKHGHSFDDQLKKKKRESKGRSYKRDTRNEKELLESNIVVESSLNRELERNRKISNLVKEKFVDNTDLKDKIDFKEAEDDSVDENKEIEKILYANKKDKL